MTPFERRLLVLMLGMLAAITPISIDMYLPGFPAIQASLNAAAADVQLSLSIFMVGLAVGQLIYGPLSDRFGRKPVLLWGLFAYAITSLLCAVALTIEAFILFRFLQSLGACAGMVLGRAIVRDYFPPNQTARLMSLLGVIMLMGPLLSPIIGGHLLVLAGWRSVFWLMAALGVVFFVVVALSMQESHPHAARVQLNLVKTFKAYFEVLSNRQACGYAACLGFGSGATFAYISSAPFVLIQLYGIEPDLFGYYHGIILLNFALFAIANSRLVLRAGLDRMIKYGNIIRLAGTFLLLFCTIFQIGGLPGLILALTLCTCPNAIVTPNASSGVLHLFPRITGTASAVLGAAMFAFGAVAASIVGVFNDNTVTPMVVTVVICSWGSVGCYWLLVTLPGRAALTEKTPN